MDTKPFTTSDRLKQLMKERKLKQVDILHMVEPYCKAYGITFGKSAISQYVNGSSAPGQEKLSILGLALNVNEAWLMGYDMPRDRKMPTSIVGDGLDGEMMNLFALLNDGEKRIIIAQTKGILSSR